MKIILLSSLLITLTIFFACQNNEKSLETNISDFDQSIQILDFEILEDSNSFDME